MDHQTARAHPLSPGDVRLLVAAGVLSVASGVTRFTDTGSVLPFVVSGLALAALAALVALCVDRLGTRLGAGGTGVLQAALGNLPELFFGIFALRAGLVTVVQSALIGSILANVLLVMGVAFIAGGVRHGDQRFHADPARNMVLLMALAVAVLIIPTATANLHVPAADHEGAGEKFDHVSDRALGTGDQIQQQPPRTDRQKQPGEQIDAEHPERELQDPDCARPSSRQI